MKYKLKSNNKYNPFMSTSIRDLIFSNRGIDNIAKYVSPCKEDMLDPYALDNMKEAVYTLDHIIKKNEEIFIVVDSDVDGFTSASIIYNYIKDVYPEARLSWMVHANKAHGIDMDRIPEGISLVICPDSSSNEYEKHEQLVRQGITTIVLDHHEAPHYSKHATVVNNQLSDNYENKSLSGAGVALKFCQAVDEFKGTDFAEKYYDLAAFGMVADAMDVRTPENRYIIQEGLKRINNPFLKTLIKRQEFSLGSHALNAVGIMFYLAPPVNAITRVGTLEEREMLFEAFINGEEQIQSTKRGATETTKETVAEQAVRIAMNSRNRQKKVVDEFKQRIEDDLAEQDLTNSPLILVKLDSIPNRNLTGLIANQLAAKYKRPVLLMVDQHDGSFSGSGRNYNFHGLDNLKDCIQQSDLFEFAEGHQSAFGAKIMEDQIETFLEKLDTIMPEGNSFEDQYIVDFIFNAGDFTVDIIREITKLRSLWGKGFDEVMIAVENIPVNPQNFSVMGKTQNHIKFVYNNITYVKFWAKEEDIAMLKDKEVTVNLVGRCDVNIWNDNFTYQVIINDYIVAKEGVEFAF